MRNRLTQESSMNCSLCNPVFRGKRNITDYLMTLTWVWNSPGGTRVRNKVLCRLQSDQYYTLLKPRLFHPNSWPQKKEKGKKEKKEKHIHDCNSIKQTHLWLKVKSCPWLKVKSVKKPSTDMLVFTLCSHFHGIHTPGKIPKWFLWFAYLGSLLSL